MRTEIKGPEAFRDAVCKIVCNGEEEEPAVPPSLNWEAEAADAVAVHRHADGDGVANAVQSNDGDAVENGDGIERDDRDAVGDGDGVQAEGEQPQTRFRRDATVKDLFFMLQKKMRRC